MTALRRTACTICLQSGDGSKSARDAAILRSMRTAESYLAARFAEFHWYILHAEKIRFASRLERISVIHQLAEMSAPRLYSIQSAFSCADHSSGRSIRLSSFSALRSAG